MSRPRPNRPSTRRTGLLPRSVGIALCFAALVWVADSLQAAEVRFNRDVRPILAEHCLHCHGPDAAERKGDLRLDVERDAKWQAIVAGDPKKSPFIQRLVTEDLDDRMPPEGEGAALSPEDIAMLTAWVEQGAPFEGHWAFEPIRKPSPPESDDDQLSDIDRFLVARLRVHGLEFSPPVDRVQWLRRVSFDLTGLPPTWEEVQAFLDDPSPEAEARVVDRYLDSPRYGEHWGRHWLDIARYADTHGGSAIGFTKFPFSYTYRDYVIGAFNADLAYDRFITEQLAADQLDLPGNDPALSALGFLTIGQRFRTRHDILDDQIDVVTRGLMGLTVTCARCHDHKFDPIPTRDYYSLYATLAGSHAPDLLPLVGDPPETESYQEYRSKLEDLQRQYDDMAREQGAVMRGRLRMQVGMYLKALAQGMPEQDLSVSFLSFRTDDLRPHVLERWRRYLRALGEEDPVFGPWNQWMDVPAEGFSEGLAEAIDRWKQDNGDLSKATPQHQLNATVPRWNPLVVEALDAARPSSAEAMAEVYGQLFATHHREWLQARIQASEEATLGTTVVPDQDPKHRIINSAVLRQLRHHLYRPGSPTAMSDAEAAQLLNRTVSDQLNGRRGAIHNLHLQDAGSPPRSMALAEPTASPEQAYHVFRRGQPLDRGEQVQPRFLSVMDDGSREPFRRGQRRRMLAASIVSPDNPLTRRVVVNWVWRHHFGRGLVRTPDDFGTRGEPPTHPDLLDYLAATFAEDGWSIKQLHRRILLSRAYRQSSVEQASSRIVDPLNQWLWRMPRQRLGLEAMRDAMLFASGELDATMGGRPFDMMARPITPRRSVYGFVNRDVPSPLLTTFDGANPSACTAKRPDTMVPQQTLFALNSAFIQDRAAAMVERADFVSAESHEAKIRLLYQCCFSRQPQADESAAAMAFVAQWSDLSESDPWRPLAHALLASNEFVFVD